MWTIFVKGWDMVRLKRVLDIYRDGCSIDQEYAANFAEEMGRSKIIVTDRIPSDVVSLNSRVRLRDIDANKQVVYTIVLPQDAEPAENHISILAPLGTAILGCRVGDEVECKVPAGSCRLRLEEVLHLCRNSRNSIGGESYDSKPAANNRQNA